MTSPTGAALVTGANKGIGLGIVKELCRQNFPGTVYLTSRDAGRGEAALADLKNEGFKNVALLKMDVLDRDSIENARDFIKEKHGGLDILVNNAAIFLGEMETGGGIKASESAENIRKTIDTNFTGLLDCCKILFPILRPHARVVNVSSSLGSLRHLKNPTLSDRLIADDLTVSELEKIAADYVGVAGKGDPVAAGYPSHFGSYSMSKILVTALSIVQQRQFDRNGASDIVVNACCPGFVATDLNHHMGTKTIEQGADTPTYLALLPAEKNEKVTPRGQLVYERVVKDWKNDK